MNKYPSFLTPAECNRISKVIYRDERQVLNIPNDWDNPYTGLTKQHTVYNWLTNEDILPFDIPHRLHTQVAELREHKTIAIQCWANILRQGEELMIHTHGDGIMPPFWAINIFLSGNPNTGTYFTERREVHKNSIGELVIVDDKMEHGVNENIYEEPRISLAIDVYTSEKQVDTCRRGVREYQLHSNRFVFSNLEER